MFCACFALRFVLRHYNSKIAHSVTCTNPGVTKCSVILHPSLPFWELIRWPADWNWKGVKWRRRRTPFHFYHAAAIIEGMKNGSLRPWQRKSLYIIIGCKILQYGERKRNGAGHNIVGIWTIMVGLLLPTVFGEVLAPLGDQIAFQCCYELGRGEVMRLVFGNSCLRIVGRRSKDAKIGACSVR